MVLSLTSLPGGAFFLVLIHSFGGSSEGLRRVRKAGLPATRLSSSKSVATPPDIKGLSVRLEDLARFCFPRPLQGVGGVNDPLRREILERLGHGPHAICRPRLDD